jgi:hypothetical protein
LLGRTNKHHFQTVKQTEQQVLRPKYRPPNKLHNGIDCSDLKEVVESLADNIVQSQTCPTFQLVELCFQRSNLRDQLGIYKDEILGPYPFPEENTEPFSSMAAKNLAEWVCSRLVDGEVAEKIIIEAARRTKFELGIAGDSDRKEPEDEVISEGETNKVKTGDKNIDPNPRLNKRQKNFLKANYSNEPSSVPRDSPLVSAVTKLLVGKIFHITGSLSSSSKNICYGAIELSGG